MFLNTATNNSNGDGDNDGDNDNLFTVKYPEATE